MKILKQLEAVLVAAKSVHSITLAAKATKLLAKSVGAKKANNFRQRWLFCGIYHPTEKIPIPWDFLKKSGIKIQKKSHGIEK